VAAHGDDRQHRRRLSKQPCRRDAVEHGHLDVDHDRVRRLAGRELDELAAVAGAAGDGETAVLLEQPRDRLEERLVVLGDDDPEARLQRTAE
jgi:hypothetical protein